MIGIYAGRFQPFHLGHFQTIKYILSKCDETFVLICSKKGENPLDDKNPFTFEERRAMMRYYNNKAHFRHICDQDNDKEWTNIIDGTLPKGRKVCFTNNPRTKEAFTSHKFEVNPIPVQEGGLSATMIRKLIIRNEDWKSLVPQGTIDIVEKIRNV